MNLLCKNLMTLKQGNHFYSYFSTILFNTFYGQRNRSLETEIFRLKEIHEQELKTYKTKMESHIDLCKQEIEVLKQKVL